MLNHCAFCLNVLHIFASSSYKLPRDENRKWLSSLVLRMATFCLETISLTRLFHFTVKSRSNGNLSSLVLPSHLTNLLSAPTGHCFVCGSSYFTAAFFQEESANTALRVARPSCDILQRLRDTAYSFAFCCCSRNCLAEVGRLRDIPD